MKEVPLPAAEFITKYLEIQEKKSSKRDYKIFIFGVIATAVLSIIIAVLLHLFGI